ncbi:MAG: PAS domain S-box protein [Calditrichota bacterium]
MLQQTGIIRLRVKATPALPIIFISENISDLGYKAEELIAERTPFINMVHPDELNRLRSEVINFLNQGVTIYEQTFRIRNKNGGWRWVNDRIIVERDENGIPVALEGLLIDITEIKRLEEQLSKSKENYATLFHKIYDPVVIIDRETLTFIDVNNAAINAYGYTHEEFLQMVPKDLRSTDHYDSVNEQIAEFDFSKVQSCVHQIKKGDKIYVEIISTEGFYAGRPVYISTLRDVTHQHEVDVERRELIASVEQSREFLNTVLDAIPNPVYVKDTSNQFIGYNIAFEKYLGDPNSDWRGKTTLEVSSNPAVGRKHYEMDMELFKNPGQQVFDSQLTFNDGKVHDVVMYRATFETRDGSIGGLVGTVLDITHRKEMEDKLLEQKALLEEAQRIAHMGVWSWDLKANTFIWTDPLFEMLGIEKTAKLDYQQYIDILHSDDEATTVQAFQEAIKSTNNSFETINRAYDKTGKLKHFQIIGKLLRNSDNRVERVIGIGRNITPQIENEHRLMQLIHEVKEVNNELNDFAYIVSHDLKAPLRSINSLSQWIVEDYASQMPAEAAEMLQLMSKQVERMHRNWNRYS